MGELEYLLMLTEIASEHGVTIKEVDAQMVQDMTDFWDNPKPEGEDLVQEVSFPAWTGPPTPREAIPVLAEGGRRFEPQRQTRKAPVKNFSPGLYFCQG